MLGRTAIEKIETKLVLQMYHVEENSVSLLLYSPEVFPQQEEKISLRWGDMQSRLTCRQWTLGQSIGEVGPEVPLLERHPINGLKPPITFVSLVRDRGHAVLDAVFSRCFFLLFFLSVCPVTLGTDPWLTEPTSCRPQVYVARVETATSRAPEQLVLFIITALSRFLLVSVT